METTAKQLKHKEQAPAETPYKKKEVKRSIYYIGKFKHQVGRKFSLPELECLGDEMLAYMDNPEIIWLRGFFTNRRISPKTIPALRSKSDYFNYCYEIAWAIQEERLVTLGLSRNNATAIFTLKAQHNWNEAAQEDEIEDNEIVFDWPSEEETEEAKARLKEKRIYNEMLLIVRQQERNKEPRK